MRPDEVVAATAIRAARDAFERFLFSEPDAAREATAWGDVLDTADRARKAFKATHANSESTDGR